MAELADAADSKSAGAKHLGGSTPPPGTNYPAVLSMLYEGSIRCQLSGAMCHYSKTVVNPNRF